MGIGGGILASAATVHGAFELRDALNRDDARAARAIARDLTSMWSGGLAGAIAAGGAAAELLRPLTAGGPVGAAVYLVVVGASALAGGYWGANASNDLIDKIGLFDRLIPDQPGATYRIDPYWTATDLGNGVRLLKASAQDGSVLVLASGIYEKLQIPDGSGGYVEIGTGSRGDLRQGMVVSKWAGQPGQSDGETLSVRPQGGDPEGGVWLGEHARQTADGGVTKQSVSLRRITTDQTTGERITTETRTTYASDGVTVTGSETSETRQNASGLLVSRLVVSYAADTTTVLATQTTTRQPDNTLRTDTHDGQGNLVRRRELWVYDDGSTLESDVGADGRGTLSATDTSGAPARTLPQVREGGIEGTTGTVTDTIAGKTTELAVDFASGDIQGVRSIGGQSLGSSGDAALDAGDYRASGLTLASLGSGNLPPIASALLESLDPATQTANGWAPPQLTVTELDGGLTERRITLGSGAELASVRDDDRRVLRVIYQRDDTDSAGDPRRTITTENRHTDGSADGPVEDLRLRQTDTGNWLPQSRTWRSTGTDPDTGERSTTETRTTYASDESTCVRRKRQGGGCTQSAFHSKERRFYVGYGHETLQFSVQTARGGQKRVSGAVSNKANPQETGESLKHHENDSERIPFDGGYVAKRL